MSLTYLSLGGIEARSGDTAQPEGSFGASDFYGAVSYSHPLGDSLTVGVTGKFIQEKIGSEQAGTYAADIGVMQALGRYSVGAALTNVGPPVKFLDRSFALPRTLRGGVSVDAAPVPVRITAEAESQKGESDILYRMGLEYAAGKKLTLRGGYLSYSAATRSALKGGALADAGLGGWVGMTGGFGLRLGGYAFDYAFVPYGELGNSHKMSFSVRF